MGKCYRCSKNCKTVNKNNPKCEQCINERLERVKKYYCCCPHPIRRSKCKLCPRLLFEGTDFEVVDGEIVFSEFG
jgi:hypothetical protein